MARDLPIWGRNPWWIPPFLGQVPPDLPARQTKLLGAVALALLVEEYDTSMLNAALALIARDLGVAENELGTYLGFVRLGALPAFLVVPLADRIGRRSVFLWSLALTGILTFATAFARTPVEFVGAQMLARTFFVSASSVAFVMVTEEFPAAHRGWGIGMLGALGSVGHGLGVGLYAGLTAHDLSWRWLYVAGLIPTLAVPFYFARRVPETERFLRFSRERGEVRRSFRDTFAPLVALVRASPRRALGVVIVAFVPAVGLVSAFQLTGYHTQRVHGWTGGEYATMVLVGGAFGIVGNVVAGRLGDRYGRRWIGLALLGAFPVFVATFYRGSGFLLPLSWVLFLFSAQGGRVILRALATELFPTSQRSSASGLYTILETLGAASGLFLLSWLATASGAKEGDLARIIPWLACAVVLGALVLIGFPETRHMELEEIAPERA